MNFRFLYPPVAILLFAIPFAMFGDHPNYSYFLIVQYVFVAGCAWVAYLLVHSQTRSKTFALVISIIVFAYILQLDGKFVILEPITLFFGMLCLWFLTRNKPVSFFMSGIFLGLAFLSKQYGIGYAVPCGLVLLLTRRLFVKSVILFSSGFMVPLILCFAVFVCLFGLPLSGFGDFIWNGDYGIRTVDAFKDKVLHIVMVNLLFLAPSIILALMALYGRSRHRRDCLPNRLEITLLCAGGCMLSTLYFPPFAFVHYGIFIIPLLIVSFSLYFFRMAGSDDYGKSIVALYVLFAFFSINPILRWTAYEMKLSYRSQQEATGKSIARIVPSGSKVVVLSSELEKYRFLCSWSCALPMKVGFDWYYMVKAPLERDLLSHCDYVLALQQDTATIKDLDGLPFREKARIDDIVIFSRFN